MAGDSAPLDKIIAFGSIGFGVLAAAAPKAFLGGYGLTDAPAARIITRLWGSRNIVLGALYLSSDSPSDKARMQQVTLALNVADTAMIATAGGVSSASRLKGAVTTAAFAAMSAAQVAKR